MQPSLYVCKVQCGVVNGMFPLTQKLGWVSLSYWKREGAALIMKLADMACIMMGSRIGALWCMLAHYSSLEGKGGKIWDGGWCICFIYRR